MHLSTALYLKSSCSFKAVEPEVAIFSEINKAQLVFQISETQRNKEQCAFINNVKRNIFFRLCYAQCALENYAKRNVMCLKEYIKRWPAAQQDFQII